MESVSKEETKRYRLSEIDFMRSLAIVIMIFANSFPYAAGFEPPGILRLLMSLAAPLFIFLSGFTTTINPSSRTSNLTTAGALFLSACLIDTFIWQIVPFYTFDVLYCIAAASLINGAIKYTLRGQIALIFSTLILYAAIRSFLPYENEITELSLEETDAISLGHALSQAFTNGWFPFLPWMTFAFLGRLYGMNRERVDPIILKLRPIILACLPIAVFLDYTDSQSPMRMGYIEVFYPPSALYLLLAFIWIAVLLSFKDLLSKIEPSTFFLTIGKSSLLIYILHAAMNHYFFEERNLSLNAIEYSILVATLLLIFHFVSILHQLSKKHTLYRSCPILVRKIFGI
jgi:uncharacterized membrane protein